MNLRTLACLAGLAGGLVWVGRAFLGEDPSAVYWVGFGLLAVALAAAGATLVKKGTWWLRLIVAVAFPLLVWSLYAAVRPAGDPLVVDGVAGALAMVVAVLFVARAPASSHRPGSHVR
jgi:hypothetical protein